MFRERVHAQYVINFCNNGRVATMEDCNGSGRRSERWKCEWKSASGNEALMKLKELVDSCWLLYFASDFYHLLTQTL